MVQATNQSSVAPSPYAMLPGQTALTPEQMAEADLYFAQLAEEAVYEEWKYQSARVPAHLQEYWLTTHPESTAAAAPPPEGDAGPLGVCPDPPAGAFDTVFDPRVRPSRRRYKRPRHSITN